MGLGATTFVLALVEAATGSATFSAELGSEPPKLLMKFWNLALYCSNGLSAAAARSGSASTADVEKRMVCVCEDVGGLEFGESRVDTTSQFRQWERFLARMARMEMDGA